MKHKACSEICSSFCKGKSHVYCIGLEKELASQAFLLFFLPTFYIQTLQTF